MRQGADLDQRLDLLGADAEQFASPPSAFATWQIRKSAPQMGRVLQITPMMAGKRDAQDAEDQVPTTTTKVDWVRNLTESQISLTDDIEIMADPERFERPTPRFVVWCSIQLSYGSAVGR